MNASEFGCGQGHELAKTWAKAGGELADFTALSQSVNKCQQVITYLRGEAEIVAKGVEIVPEKTTHLLRQITTVALLATDEKKTADSFLGDRYYYRDDDLDSQFPKVQPTGNAGKFTAHQLEKELNFEEVAQAILGMNETSLDDLAKGFVERGHTVVLPQIESLIERTDAGENTGLRTNGYANFFFVENKEGGVSVVHVDRHDDGRWCVYVYHFGDGSRWYVEYRFFSRN